MPSPKTAMTQSELTRYAKAMRAAGYDDWRIDVAKPDGTKVLIVAGQRSADAEHDDIDAMVARVPDP